MGEKDSIKIVAFSCVKASKSKDYEDGHAATAFANLKKKYQPSMAVSLMNIEMSIKKPN